MSWHLAWVWLWYLLGAAVFNAKRAYYLITGPNPVANSLSQFIQRAWIPITSRLFIESMCYWLFFTPQITQTALSYMGWQEAAGALSQATAVAPLAGLFGYAIDSLADWAIGTIVKKIPFIGEVWPQMPGRL